MCLEMGKVSEYDNSIPRISAILILDQDQKQKELSFSRQVVQGEVWVSFTGKDGVDCL